METYNRKTKKFSESNQVMEFVDKYCTVVDAVNEFMPESEYHNVLMNDCYITSVVHLDELPKDSTLNFLVKLGVTKVESSFSKDVYHKNPVANIGFNPKEQKWYGWSHRACHGFGVGDEGLELSPYETKKSSPARNLDEAKQYAINFAESVS